jgi:hypothetical protein
MVPVSEAEAGGSGGAAWMGTAPAASTRISARWASTRRGESDTAVHSSAGRELAV